MHLNDLNILLNKNLTTIDYESIINNYPGNCIKLAIIAENNNNILFKIPNLLEFPNDLKAQLYDIYIARIKSRNFCLGNPSSIYKLQIVDNNNNRIIEYESEELNLCNIISNHLNNELKLPFLNKVNSGNKIQIIPDLKNVKININSNKPILKNNNKINKNNIITVGYDIGGQTFRVCVKLNNVNVSDELFPENINEHALKQNDNTLRSWHSFPYNKIHSGISGLELSNRLENYVIKTSQVITQKYSHINSIFISMPGSPDYANDRMSSFGNLSIGFDQNNIKTEIDNANQFIKNLRKYFNNKTIFSFGNDMNGAALSIASEAGFDDCFVIFGGTGIGVTLIENGYLNVGINEGGHFTYKPYGQAEPKNPDSLPGSFEVYGGSKNGILNSAKNNQLLNLIQTHLKPNRSIEIKDIGMLAANDFNDFNNHVNIDIKNQLSSLALKVWDQIEEVESEHILSLYLQSKKKFCAFGGGTTTGKTGKIRMQFLSKHLLNNFKKFFNDFENINLHTFEHSFKIVNTKLNIDLITVNLVSVNPSSGAADKALQLFHESEIA